MNLEAEINQRIEYLKQIDENHPDYFELHNLLKAKINYITNKDLRDEYYDKLNIFTKHKRYG